MDETIHAGLELSGTYRPTANLSITANTTFSKNYIKSGNTYFDSVKVILDGNELGGFPSLLGNLIVSYANGNFGASVYLKYNGEFYSDNYEDKAKEFYSLGYINYDDNRVDAFFVTNISAYYRFSFGENLPSMKITAQVNNLFDNLYAQYAVGKEFFPAAERNFLLGVKLEL